LIGVAVVVVAGVAVWIVQQQTGKTTPPPDRSRGLGSYEYRGDQDPYYGNRTLFNDAAVIRADDVYARIPEYQKIRQQNLKESSSAYHLLMTEASKKFTTAVRRAALNAGVDLVGEIGTVRAAEEGVEPAPDLTREVIGHL
jgi:hypothetical protein